MKGWQEGQRANCKRLGPDYISGFSLPGTFSGIYYILSFTMDHLIPDYFTTGFVMVAINVAW